MGEKSIGQKYQFIFFQNIEQNACYGFIEKFYPSKAGKIQSLHILSYVRS